MASMRLLRLALAALALAGCGTSTTSSLPTPTFQAPFDAPFVLRAGDLGLIAGAGQYLYISVLHVGQDSRCAAGATCADPGYLEISFDVETATLQNSLAMSVPTSGETTRTFRGARDPDARSRADGADGADPGDRLPVPDVGVDRRRVRPYGAGENFRTIRWRTSPPYTAPCASTATPSGPLVTGSAPGSRSDTSSGR